MFKLKQALDYLVSLNPLFHHFSYLAQHLKKVRLLKKAKHLKDFHEQRALTMKTKISILMLSTSMLLAGFYFTPSWIGKSVIITVLLIKYWFFFFWIKTLEEE